MRILVIGTGTIGRAVIAALSAGNEIICASLRSTNLKVDIADPASIQQMYRSLGKLDAVVCAAGQAKIPSRPMFPSLSFTALHAMQAWADYPITWTDCGRTGSHPESLPLAMPPLCGGNSYDLLGAFDPRCGR